MSIVRELGARLVAADRRLRAVRGRRRQLHQPRARDVGRVLEDVAHVVALGALQDDRAHPRCRAAPCCRRCRSPTPLPGSDNAAPIAMLLRCSSWRALEYKPPGQSQPRDNRLRLRSRPHRGAAPYSDALGVGTAQSRCRQVCRELSGFLSSASSLQRLERRHAIDVERARCVASDRRWRRGAASSDSCARRARACRSALELRHDLARTRDHLLRQAGEPRDVDAVALVRAAGDDAAEEHDLVLVLAHRDRDVAHARARVGERDELVIVRREQRARADRVVQVLGDRPRDRDAVERRRAAADLVEDDERAARGLARGCSRSRASRP